MTIGTSPESSPHSPLTPERAVLLGHLVVSLPALIVMVLVPVIGYVLEGRYGAVIGFLVGLIVAWLLWWISIRRWKEWAKLRGADEEQTRFLAEKSLLVWPKGFVFTSSGLRTRFGMMFIAHQVIVLWVVIVSAGILTASAVNFLHLFGWQHPINTYRWILNGTPYFPAHVLLGLLLGWLLARSLEDRTMIWVWVLPSALMVYALVAIPTLAPRFVLPGFQAGVGQTPWVHYFGRNCQLGNYCIDQTSFTRPFYVSIAYSVAALIALKTLKQSRRSAIIQYWMVLIVGILFVVAVIYDSVQSFRLGGWHWQYLQYEGTPAAMGMYLILLAFGIPRKPAGNEVIADHAASPIDDIGQ
jgi:hypothetical protein